VKEYGRQDGRKPSQKGGETLTKRFNKVARERTKIVLSIIASKIDDTLLAHIIVATGLRAETIKRYIIEAANGNLHES